MHPQKLTVSERHLVEFDSDWDQLPIAELRQLDALCDRFERAIAQDPTNRFEAFIIDLPESRQRLVVREMELVEGPTLEEHLRVSGMRPADEVAMLA